MVTDLPQRPAAVKCAVAAWPWILAALSGLALVFPFWALPIAVLALLSALAGGTRGRSSGRWSRWVVGGSALLASIGLARFVVVQAMPGIVRGGESAVQRRAVSRLRQLLVVQDSLRRNAWIDPDQDGVGSAALIGELCGGPPLRGQPARRLPALSCPPLRQGPFGPAARHGVFEITVCLPRWGGGWSAEPVADVDEERAERNFVAYAWPIPGARVGKAFAIDQHENILEKSITEAAAAAGPPLGCRAALLGEGWSAWRGKRPRPTLPGDSPEAARTGLGRSEAPGFAL